MKHFREGFSIWEKLPDFIIYLKFMVRAVRQKNNLYDLQQQFGTYYELFSWLKIQHSFANVSHLLPCVCSMWVFNTYSLMIRLNLGMTFDECL